MDFNLGENDREFYKDLNRIERRWVRYEGEFENDKKHGRGRLYFPNGLYVAGEFYNDNLHGEATLLNSNGHIVMKGVWEMNKFTAGSTAVAAAAQAAFQHTS